MSELIYFAHFNVRYPVQPVFLKCILCAIYGPICKHAKKIMEKKILNVTTVKLFTKIKNQCFGGVLMPLVRFKHLSRPWLTCFCLKIAPKTPNNSKFTKELHYGPSMISQDQGKTQGVFPGCLSLRHH